MDNIHPFIRRESFDPEAVQAISIAFENVCAALMGAQQSELIRETVAIKIIALALAGEHDSTKLYLRCMEMYQDKSEPPATSA
jgi:hypothetical protein